MGWIALQSSERFVYGVFLDHSKGKVLLMDDGEYCTLPGGAVQEKESDGDALYRFVLQQLGLKCEMQYSLGEPWVDENGTSVAYVCDIIQHGTGSHAYRFYGYDELRKGVRVKHIGSRMCTLVPLQLVGPKDRTVGIARAVYDAFSLLRPYCSRAATRQQSDDIIIDDGFLSRVVGREEYRWQRLDPHSSTGYMPSPEKTH